MDAPTTIPTVKYRRWLPYWAVLQTDLRQTLRSWVYRLWVLTMILAAAGYVLYRYGVHREAGLIQSANIHSSDLFRGIGLTSLALVVILTVSSISSERANLGDSILCRGISRYQYFLAKWHARTFAILITFMLMAAITLVTFHYLLSGNLTFSGGLMGVILVGALLAAVAGIGVTVGALTNSSVLGITVLWIVLYGSGYLMTLLPEVLPSPQQIFERLPHILQGHYDSGMIGEWVLGSCIVSIVVAGLGMLGFARKDV